MFKIKHRLIAAVLLINILLTGSVGMFPEKSFATGVPVIDAVNVVQTTSSAISNYLTSANTYSVNWKELILDKFVYELARTLIRQLTQSIVDWINSGFQGNPSFVQDPQSFLESTADRAIGEFIFSSDLNFLCDPFRVNVRLALGLQYSPFKDTINCRLTDILKNTKGAYEDFVGGDFIGGGGWDSWLSITTVPQNNQLGAMLIAQSELDARINNQKLLKDKELDRNSGFLSMKECERTTIDYTKAEGSEGVETKKVIKFTGDPVYQPVGTQSSETRDLNRADGGTYGSVTDKCKVTTPGTLINQKLEEATGSDLRRLELADEFNEIVGALATLMITKIMETSVDAFSKRDKAADESEWRRSLAELQSRQNSLVSRGAQNSTARDMSGMNDALSLLYSGDISGNDVNTSQKQNLLDTISAFLPIEERYYMAYLSIQDNANKVQSDAQNVITCFNNKIASTTITYTSSERNESSAAINTASSTVAQMAVIKNRIFNDLKASENNMNQLGIIGNSINQAYNNTQLDIAQNNLAALVPSLHSQASSTEAVSYASSTIATEIRPKAITIVNLQEQCNAFPDR